MVNFKTMNLLFILCFYAYQISAQNRIQDPSFESYNLSSCDCNITGPSPLCPTGFWSNGITPVGVLQNTPQIRRYMPNPSGSSCLATPPQDGLHAAFISLMTGSSPTDFTTDERIAGQFTPNSAGSGNTLLPGTYTLSGYFNRPAGFPQVTFPTLEVVLYISNNPSQNRTIFTGIVPTSWSMFTQPFTISSSDPQYDRVEFRMKRQSGSSTVALIDNVSIIQTPCLMINPSFNPAICYQDGTTGKGGTASIRVNFNPTNAYSSSIWEVYNSCSTSSLPSTPIATVTGSASYIDIPANGISCLVIRRRSSDPACSTVDERRLINNIVSILPLDATFTHNLVINTSLQTYSTSYTPANTNSSCTHTWKFFRGSSSTGPWTQFLQYNTTGGNVANIGGLDKCTYYKVEHSITRNNPCQTSVTTKTITYSCPTGRIGNSQEILVYPNPFSNELRVSLNLETSEKWTVSLINSLGQVVNHYENVTSSELTISCNDLPKGLYQLVVIDEKGNRKIKSVVAN